MGNIAETTESKFFMDDPRWMANLLKENWSLGEDLTPDILYELESSMADAREGQIFVYQVSRYNSISSTDYNTLQRTSYIGIRLSTRSREMLYMYMDEIYRIIYDFRRAGPDKIQGYTWMELVNDHIQEGMMGWYVATMDVKMMSYCYPLKTSGLGPSR